MTAPATRSATSPNLARWQARLATAEAAYRQREAQAHQLYPGSEAQRRQYCQQQQRDCARYAAFVAQALAHESAEALVAVPPAPQPAPAPRKWWARLRQRWTGWLTMALFTAAGPVAAQGAPQLHVWPAPLDVFSQVYLPLSSLGPGAGAWHVRITPEAAGPAVLDRRLPGAECGLSFSVLSYSPGTYLVTVDRAGRYWTTRLVIPALPE